MAPGCIFCDIVAGRAPASVVYADDRTLAIMDLIQRRPGHVLVMPRQHIPNIYQLDEESGAALMAGVIRVARAVAAAFHPAGLSITQANGEAAGQEIFHLHLHILPRAEGDVVLPFPGLPPTERSELDELAALLRKEVRIASTRNQLP